MDLYNNARVPGRCIESVCNDSRSFSWHQCKRKAVTGSDWCKTHDPVQEEARRQERYDKRYAEFEAREVTRNAPFVRIKKLEDTMRYVLRRLEDRDYDSINDAIIRIKADL